MLGLKLPTDPRWANLVEMNLEEILIDHAWCEQKATSTAISIIVTNPDRTELVEAMIDLVNEEISHFKLVHQKIKDYGFKLGPQRKDEYVNQILQFFPKGGSKTDGLVHSLLYAALIEARSCERFRLLSEKLKDKELAKFYLNLMKSEANHYTMFLGFARKYGNRQVVDDKWEKLLVYEGNLIQSLGKSEQVHG